MWSQWKHEEAGDRGKSHISDEQLLRVSLFKCIHNQRLMDFTLPWCLGLRPDAYICCACYQQNYWKVRKTVDWLYVWYFTVDWLTVYVIFHCWLKSLNWKCKSPGTFKKASKSRAGFFFFHGLCKVCCVWSLFNTFFPFPLPLPLPLICLQIECCLMCIFFCGWGCVFFTQWFKWKFYISNKFQYLQNFYHHYRQC